MVARAANWAKVAPPDGGNVLLLIVGSFTTATGFPVTLPLPVSVTLPPWSRMPTCPGPGGSQLAQPVGTESAPLTEALPDKLVEPCVVSDARMPKSTGAMRVINPTRCCAPAPPAVAPALVDRS